LECLLKFSETKSTWWVGWEIVCYLLFNITNTCERKI
jgi:hypothetical protein